MSGEMPKASPRAMMEPVDVPSNHVEIVAQMQVYVVVGGAQTVFHVTQNLGGMMPRMPPPSMLNILNVPLFSIFIPPCRDATRYVSLSFITIW